MSALLLVCVGVLCGCGAWLILDRHLSRVVIGIGLLGHGVNVALMVAGVRAVIPRSWAVARTDSPIRCPKPWRSRPS